MFLLLRHEGKNGWNSGPPDRLMRLRAGRPAAYGGPRLYRSSARHHERSIQGKPQMVVRILSTVAFALLLTNFAMAQLIATRSNRPSPLMDMPRPNSTPWLTTAHERLQLLTSV
jgi:hypothetical protein